MESHSMLTRSKTKTTSGEDKLRTPQTPSKICSGKELKKPENVKKKLLMVSPEKYLERKTSFPSQNIANVESKLSEEISSKHSNTNVETTNTTGIDTVEMCKNNINKKTEVTNIPKKRNWIEESECKTSEEVFEESKGLENRSESENTKELLKSEPRIVLTRVAERSEYVINTKRDFREDQKDNSKNKTCTADEENKDLSESIEKSLNDTGSLEICILGNLCAPKNLCSKTDNSVTQINSVKNSENILRSSEAKAQLDETNSDLNELDEKCLSGKSIKALRDEIVENKITECIPPLKRDMEESGENASCQNQLNNDNAWSKVDSDIEMISNSRTCGIESHEKEKEGQVSSVQIIDKHQTFDKEMATNTNQGESAGIIYSVDNNLKSECIQSDVSAVDTHKKDVTDTCKDGEKVSEVEDGLYEEERLISNIHLLGCKRKVLTKLSEDKKQENASSSSGNVSQHKHLYEHCGDNLSESDYQKQKNCVLLSENGTFGSANENKQKEIDTESSHSNVGHVALCQAASTETNEFQKETGIELQHSQCLPGEVLKKSNKKNCSSVKLANLSSDDTSLPSTNQTGTERISLLRKKCDKYSEEDSSCVSSAITDTCVSKCVEVSCTIDNGKYSGRNENFKIGEGISNTDLQLTNVDTGSLLHTSEVFSNKQCSHEKDVTCSQICQSLPEQEQSANHSRECSSIRVQNQNTKGGDMVKCMLDTHNESFQVNTHSAVGEQTQISCGDDKNVYIKCTSTSEASNEQNNVAHKIVGNTLTNNKSISIREHTHVSLFKQGCNGNMSEKCRSVTKASKTMNSLLQNNTQKVTYVGGNCVNLSCSSSSNSNNDVVIEQSADNNYFAEEYMSQKSEDHEKVQVQEKLQTYVHQVQERNCLLDINLESSKKGNNGSEKPVSENTESFQNEVNKLFCLHVDNKNVLSDKLMCHYNEGCMCHCICNKILSNHCNVYKYSENIISSHVIPSVMSTITNYFNVMGLSTKHLQTIKEQIGKDVRSVMGSLHHTSYMNPIPNTLFVNKEQVNIKKKNKKKKNQSINVHLKEGKNKYLQNYEQINKDNGHSIKEAESYQNTKFEHKKIKSEYEIIKDTTSRNTQIKNTISNKSSKSVLHGELRLSGKEKVQSPYAIQMTDIISARGEEIYTSGPGQDINQRVSGSIKRKRNKSKESGPVKIMKLERKTTSGNNVFSIFGSYKVNKDKRKGYTDSLKKVKKLKHKFNIERDVFDKKLDSSYSQPTFQRNSALTVSENKNMIREVMKPDNAKSFQKVNEAKYKFKVETVNVPKGDSSCKLMVFQSGARTGTCSQNTPISGDCDLPRCGEDDCVSPEQESNNVKAVKMKTKKQKVLGTEWKQKFNTKTSNDVEGKLKSSSGKFVFQIAENIEDEKGILEPISPHDAKSKEYLNALQEIKRNQMSSTGLNIFKAPVKAEISKDKTVGSKQTSSGNVANKESSVRRLPEDLLQAVSQNMSEEKDNKPKSRSSSSESHIKKSSKHKKKLKLKSAVLEDGYIPLNTDSATQFAVARLDKKFTLSAAEKAAQFKQNCLYGPHIKRVAVKPEYIKQKLCLPDIVTTKIENYKF